MDASLRFRRCCVLCRFATTQDWKNCMNSTRISKMRGGYDSISCMVGVYNTTTKDTRVYMETDRIQEKPLRDLFEACGAKTFRCDSFGLEWEAGSVNALSDVRECSGKEGFELMETGVAPTASARSGSNVAGDLSCQCV